MAVKLVRRTKNYGLTSYDVKKIYNEQKENEEIRKSQVFTKAEKTVLTQDLVTASLIYPDLSKLTHGHTLKLYVLYVRTVYMYI